jgi:hypothetical protein
MSLLRPGHGTVRSRVMGHGCERSAATISRIAPADISSVFCRSSKKVENNLLTPSHGPLENANGLVAENGEGSVVVLVCRGPASSYHIMRDSVT